MEVSGGEIGHVGASLRSVVIPRDTGTVGPRRATPYAGLPGISGFFFLAAKMARHRG
jgi:hypothetical protein